MRFLSPKWFVTIFNLDSHPQYTLGAQVLVPMHFRLTPNILDTDLITHYYSILGSFNTCLSNDFEIFILTKRSNLIYKVACCVRLSVYDHWTQRKVTGKRKDDRRMESFWLSRSWNPVSVYRGPEPRSWEPNIEVLKPRSWEWNPMSVVLLRLSVRLWPSVCNHQFVTVSLWSSVVRAKYRGHESQVLRAKCSNTTTAEEESRGS
jgi:hypothetical protein